ncbi:WD40/YVTN/BNR-like repeat-containing protein [Chloroflexota bacterium]
MKTKYACLWLALAALCLLLPSLSTKADEEALKWVEINKPGPNGNIIASSSEVSEIAVGRGGNIYAINSENSTVYKSINGGASWDDIASNVVAAGAGLPASKIVLAPDSSSMVAAVTDGGSTVYLSTDGGGTWTDTSVPTLAGTIQTMAISRQYTEGDKTLREVAIGTAAWGDNTTTGQVWVLQWGGPVSTWRNQNLTVDPNHVGGEVSAITYSSSYQKDNTIVVIASTGNDTVTNYQNKTWLCLGKRDTSAGATSWDAFSEYPVEITNSAGDAFGISRISSSLALPSNYSGSQESLRQLFVSYDRYPEDANDDVYRFDDTACYRLDANDGANIDISSITYSGTTTSGKLITGDVNPITGSLAVRVRRTANPFDSTVTWQTATVSPTGPGNAKISYSPEGNVVYCGTGQSPEHSLDESAFSMSSDDGDNWQQLSLIDTILKLADLALTPDSDTLFVTTYSTSGPEGIWRTARTRWGLGLYWSRQLAMDTTSNRVIMRLSPDYASDYTIYAAEVGGTLMEISHNRGNSWRWRYAPGEVIDMVVEDEDTVYVALSGGYIRKSINDVWSWTESVPTGLPDINMLAMAAKGTILVGGRDGEVAYSTDGGASFTKIREVVGTGDVQVVADTNYQKNGIIYASTATPDEGIWRWAIGYSSRWEQIDESVTTLNTGQSISGLAMGSAGTLNALRMEPASDNSGGVTRSLNPSNPDTTQIELEVVNSWLPVNTTFDPTTIFSHALPYLKLSGNPGHDDLWAIDTATEAIYHFQDSLSQIGPTLEKPANGAVIPINSRDGGIHPTLLWEELTGTTEYEVAVYLDPDCTQNVWSGTTTDTGLVITGDNKLPRASPGTIYYWRVRTVEPVKSYWSEPWSFASDLANAWSPLALSSPAPGASNVAIKPAFSWNLVSGATGYDFMLARDSNFTDVIVDMTGKDALLTNIWGCDRNLDYFTIYFWKVRAISATSHSEWETGVFTTVSEPGAESPAVVVQTAPVSVPSPPQPSFEPAPLVPSQILWVAVGIGAALIIILIVLIVRTVR